MGVRLELVIDFAELRTGMEVVLMPCGTCDGSHRSRLGGPARAANGQNGFEMDPTSFPCLGGLRIACTSMMVKNRRLYRVVEDERAIGQTKRAREMADE